MIHPALRLALARPDLIAEHASAYACLLGEGVSKEGDRLKNRLVCQVAAMALAAVALVLVGVAVLLWSALPDTAPIRPWPFWLVPAVPLLAAIALAWLGRDRRSLPSTLSSVGRQLAADAELLRGAARP